MGRVEINEYRNVYGFSIILVVVGHWFNRDPQLPVVINTLKDVIYSFHIPLFFLCSGGLSEYNNPYWKVKKFVIKIFFYYFFLFFLSSAYRYTSFGEVELLYDPWSWKFSYAWFLLVYGLIRSIDMVIGKYLKEIHVLLLILSLFVMIEKDFSINFLIARCLHWYLIGKVLKNMDVNIFHYKTSLILIVYGLLCYLFFDIQYAGGVGIGLVLFLSSKIKSEFLRALGANTFLIYLLHLYLIHVLKYALPEAVILWSFIPMSILICYLITSVNSYLKIH